jgi:hypothetical protein
MSTPADPTEKLFSGFSAGNKGERHGTESLGESVPEPVVSQGIVKKSEREW